MIHRLRVPSPPLDRFVENLWYHEGYAPPHTREKLLPDGAVEMVIELRGDAKRLYDSETSDAFRPFQGAWISGMRTSSLVIGVEGVSCMMGVRFHPDGAWPFFDEPMDAFSERVVELEEVWGREATFLRESLMESRSLEARFERLERFLLRRSRGRHEADRVVRGALRLLGQACTPVTVRGVAWDLGVSQYRLIHRFDRVLGLKPKAMHRVLRFLGALRTIERGRPLEWASLALECGYYDQAHFIREFRAFSGLNPTDYLDNRGEYLYYLPIA